MGEVLWVPHVQDESEIEDAKDSDEEIDVPSVRQQLCRQGSKQVRVCERIARVCERVVAYVCVWLCVVVRECL